jgi:hypothetical protein
MAEPLIPNLGGKWVEGVGERRSKTTTLIAHLTPLKKPQYSVKMLFSTSPFHLIATIFFLQTYPEKSEIFL